MTTLNPTTTADGTVDTTGLREAFGRFPSNASSVTSSAARRATAAGSWRPRWPPSPGSAESSSTCARVRPGHRSCREATTPKPPAPTCTLRRPPPSWPISGSPRSGSEHAERSTCPHSRPAVFTPSPSDRNCGGFCNARHRLGGRGRSCRRIHCALPRGRGTRGRLQRPAHVLRQSPGSDRAPGDGRGRTHRHGHHVRRRCRDGLAHPRIRPDPCPAQRCGRLRGRQRRPPAARR